MTDPNRYHFHRDCAYFEHCKIEHTKQDGHKVIKFYCPAYKNHKDSLEGTYYENDFDSIKWECSKFVPRQQSIFDYQGGSR